MQVALYGATGNSGSKILTELLSRGHQVTAIVRNPEKLTAQPGLTIVRGDVSSTSEIASKIKGADAVVSAYAPPANDTDQILPVTEYFLEALKDLPNVRFLVVGGAGSLFVAPGVQLVDTPAFPTQVPPNVVPGSRAARDALTALRANTTLDWTYLSPPALLAPGERSGTYRVGGEDLLMAGPAPAGISVADLAVAIVDEIETPKHVRARFTVASV